MYCDMCKKYPLELREINEVLNEKNEEVIICDNCMLKLRSKNAVNR